jgi:type VI secretion system lysozyme-like protein
MAEHKPYIQLSVFDRLSSLSDFGILGGRVADIHIVKTSVLRDVEQLLNTRRIIIKPPPGYYYLNKSLYMYGLEDFVAKNPRNPDVRKALKSSIETTIGKFEPRLRRVTVDFNDQQGNEHNLCFTVMATLYADPIHEPIYFDTWFSVNRGEYKIKNSK